MKYHNYLTIALLFILASCQNKEANEPIGPITDSQDYQKYLEKNEDSLIASLESEIAQLKAEVNGDSTRIVLNSRIAGKLDLLFDLGGNVNYLNESVRFRESVAKNTYIRPENSYRTLAQAYIKQHRFRKADSLIKSFTQEYSSNDSQMVQFDIAMELGRYQEAESLLDSLRDTNDYNYLIRAAKWNDHIGQLETTIELMERATKLAEESGSQAKKLWSYSNIADYYGHNGQLEKSYEYYLKTLELDPHNTYALKGIAWMAFSNDLNIEQAKTILTNLHKRHPIPDYHLSLAELAAYEGDENHKMQLKQQFIDEVENPAYGDMYNAYKIEEWIDLGKPQKAVDLAGKEISNRQTPEIYDLLGYALLENGSLKEALEIQEAYVLRKTFEPKAQLHSAMILKANNKLEDADALKEELLETRYEMGPVVYKEIESL